MSDLEFQRELSPDQLREALSLLDGTAGAQNQNSLVGDLNPAEEVDPEADLSRGAPERAGSAAGNNRLVCAAGRHCST
jgi:hypothetical protein